MKRYKINLETITGRNFMLVVVFLKCLFRHTKEKRFAKSESCIKGTALIKLLALKKPI